MNFTAIGTKATWTTGGWFDYMHLRVNGYQFHMDLTAGKVPYTDKRVKAVFDKWDDLVKPGYYMDNHASYQWQEADRWAGRRRRLPMNCRSVTDRTEKGPLLRRGSLHVHLADRRHIRCGHQGTDARTVSDQGEQLGTRFVAKRRKTTSIDETQTYLRQPSSGSMGSSVGIGTGDGAASLPERRARSGRG